MSLQWYENFINNMAQTPNEYYKSLIQNTINGTFDDTTQKFTIKEENYPFGNTYTDYSVWISSGSDVSTNVIKEVTDFRQILFNDITHTNYRGQKYILPDGDTYICYDKIDPLSLDTFCQVIRCNNILKWIDKNSGKIYSEPVFIGHEIDSTRNMVAKTGIIPNTRMVILAQYNDNTKTIDRNQRFVIGNSSFKVEELNNYMKEAEINNVTFMRIYIQLDALLPTDDLVNGIADYYSGNFSLTLNQTSVSQISGFDGTLIPTLLYNGYPIDGYSYSWESSDTSVVTVSNGNYNIIGTSGSTATITCSMSANSSISSTCTITVIDNPSAVKNIIVTPIISELNQLDSITFSANVYDDGVIQADTVLCSGSGLSSDYYTLQNVGNNQYQLTNIMFSSVPLVLTFSSGNLTKILSIKLNSML
jgi:hypothetical protein